MAKLSPETKASAQRANELLREIGKVRRAREVRQGRLDERAQRLQDQHGPAIEALKSQEETLVDELVKLVVPRFILLVARGTKTIKLRSGQISLRLSSPALEVADSEEAVLQRIAKAGGVRRFTRPGKRTLNKDALKKNPSFVKRIKGLLIVQHQNLVIKPSKIQGEIVRDAEGLQDPFGNEED